MEEQTKETTIEIKTIPIPNDGKPHAFEVRQTNGNPKYLVTLTRGETKIHTGLNQLFDLVTTATREIELIALIKATRQAQKKFFKTRDANYLDQAKKFEKQLDALIEQIEQPQLF
jgi:hypothetical protein